jgi:2-aminoethylphosphonate-pyruvate transaminase
MSNVDRDPILLTPGPLTTTLTTKAAMLRDWGSWDASFNAVTARVRERLTAIVNGHETHVCVPMQGSGTFSVEGSVNTLVPRDGHVLVLINGAYGKRLARLTEMMGRKLSVFETADDVPTTAADVARMLDADASITHVGLIHCETSAGILNPLPEIAETSPSAASLIVDAMSPAARFRSTPKSPFDAHRRLRKVHRRPARDGLRVRPRRCSSNVPAARPRWR